MKKPKILFYDLETSPLEIHTWGIYEQNALSVIKDWQLLSFAYKYQGDKSVRCVSRRDFTDKTDRSLAVALWNVLNDADVVIAHNGDGFDNKKATAKFIEHGLKPPAPFQSVDTLKIARRYFRFTSNKLDDLGKLLGVGRKKQTGGFDLWLKCMAGDKAAWAKMIGYNKQDVSLLERVYLKLLPWASNHPNMAYLSGKVAGCPKCSSTRLKSCGIRRFKTSTYTNYRCLNCQSYVRGAVKIKTPKATMANY